MVKRILIAFALLAFIAPALPFVATAQTMGKLATFPRGTLEIESGSKTHEFEVEIATTPRQHRQGLMFRRKMAPDAGMLFVYRRAESVAMWMKNTLIPLDMLFIARGGKVLKIAERTVPMSEKVIPSGGAVIAVLELNAGTAARLGLKPGDRVVSPALGNGAD